MSYLTGWRITLAADLFRSTKDTVESIARRVGYANAFALSVAFKRVRGTSRPRTDAQAAYLGRCRLHEGEGLRPGELEGGSVDLVVVAGTSENPCSAPGSTA